MARWEREQISKRTKEALAEKKKAGVKLGWDNKEVRKKILATKKRTKEARIAQVFKDPKKTQAPKKEKPPFLSQREIFDNKIAHTLKSLRHQGLSFKKIARNFNQTKLATRQGGNWSAVQVFRIYKRLNGRVKDSQ